jgi:hypothetical protein
LIKDLPVTNRPWDQKGGKGPNEKIFENFFLFGRDPTFFCVYKSRKVKGGTADTPGPAQVSHPKEGAI